APRQALRDENCRRRHLYQRRGRAGDPFADPSRRQCGSSRGSRQELAENRFRTSQGAALSLLLWHSPDRPLSGSALHPGTLLRWRRDRSAAERREARADSAASDSPAAARDWNWDRQLLTVRPLAATEIRRSGRKPPPAWPSLSLNLS